MTTCMSPLLLVIIAGWPFFLLQNPFFIRRPQLKPSQKGEWLLKTKSTGDCCIHSGSKHPTTKLLIPKPSKTNQDHKDLQYRGRVYLNSASGGTSDDYCLNSNHGKLFQLKEKYHI